MVEWKSPEAIAEEITQRIKDRGFASLDQLGVRIAQALREARIDGLKAAQGICDVTQARWRTVHPMYAALELPNASPHIEAEVRHTWDSGPIVESSQDRRDRRHHRDAV